MGFIDRLIWRSIGERVERLVNEVIEEKLANHQSGVLRSKMLEETRKSLGSSKETFEQLNKILETLRHIGNRPARAA